MYEYIKEGVLFIEASEKILCLQIFALESRYCRCFCDAEAIFAIGVVKWYVKFNNLNCISKKMDSVVTYKLFQSNCCCMIVRLRTDRNGWRRP